MKIKKVTLALMISLFMFACNSARKATKQIAKIKITHPELLADFCHVNYPPIYKPVSETTNEAPTISLQRIVDSLAGQVTKYKQTAKKAENRANLAIQQSYQRNDTMCANLIIDLRSNITELRDQNDNLVNTLSRLQIKYAELKAHPKTITKTVMISDSAQLYLLTTQRDNYKNQLSSKEGEIKQLNKLNRDKNIAIAIMGVIIVGGVFLKFKL